MFLPIGLIWVRREVHPPRQESRGVPMSILRLFAGTKRFLGTTRSSGKKIGARKWIVVIAALSLAGAGSSAVVIPNLFSFFDPTGFVSTYNTNGPIRENNAFFQSLGTNGRTCATCHILGNAFGLSTTDIQFRYLGTRGRDPLFASVDGANCPNGVPGNPADHSLLLQNGLIR